ncbi:MAG: DUF11 domain-containing protein [Dehalococcoidales bacterium]|nr:MAG: DUF11 domain-containing protein [Dehalococcoidales bacterium]
MANVDVTANFAQDTIDLQISKIDNPDPVAYGEDLVYTLRVTNNGTSDATSVIVTDNISPYLVYVSSSKPGSVNATSDNSSGLPVWSIQWDIGDLAVGANASLDIVTTLRPEILLFSLVGFTIGSIDNTATVTGYEIDTDPSNNTANVTTEILGTDLEITKVDVKDPVGLSDNFTWIITVTNHGPLDAENVTVIDAYSANFMGTYSANFTEILEINPSTGSVNETMPQWIDDIYYGSNISSIIPISQNSSSSMPESIMYWNIGYLASNSSANLTITGRLNPVIFGPDMEIFEALIRLMSLMGSGGFPFDLSVELLNEAAVISMVMESDASNNNANECTTITSDIPLPEADLEILKSGSPDPVAPDGTITYTVTVKNNGPEDATGVFVMDAWPETMLLSPITADTTTGTANQSPPDWLVDLANLLGGSITQPGTEALYWEVGDLPNGASANLTFSASINATLATQMQYLENTAIVMGLVNDPSSGIMSSNSNNMVMVYTGLGMADLAITKTDTPDPVAFSDNFTYTVTVSNNGPTIASGVEVIDTLPTDVTFISANTSQGTATYAGGNVTWSVGDLEVNATANMKIYVAAPEDEEVDIIVTNTATVIGSFPDPKLNNNATSENTTVTSSESFDLVITKTDNPDPVAISENITYVLTVENLGPADAESFSISDTLPAGTTFQEAIPSPSGNTSANDFYWNIEHLAHGDSVNITVVVQAPNQTGTISNYAEIVGELPEVNYANNEVTENTTVANATDADLEITKIDIPDPVDSEKELSYILTVKNNGPADASGVNVTDILPNGVTFLNTVSSQGTAVHSSNNVTWNVGDLSKGDSANLSISVLSPVVSGTINNTATVSGLENDPVKENNTASTDTTVVRSIIIIPTDLLFLKYDTPDPLRIGDTLTYTLTVNNNSPVDAENVTVIDDLATTFMAGVTYQSSSTQTGTANYSSGNITWDIGYLASGDSAKLTVLVTAPQTDCYIMNIAKITADPVVIGDENDIYVNVIPFSNIAIAVTKVTSEELIPDIHVKPESIDFGDVYVGSTSSSGIVTVSNQGNYDLNITNVSIDNDQFKIIANNLAGHILTPGSSETMSLRFSPAAYGTQTGKMTITSNDPDENLVTVTLAGTGASRGGGGAEQPVFTVDFLGEITTGLVSSDGTLLEDIVAPSPDGTHVIEFEKGTRASADGAIITYITIREAEAPELPENTVLVEKAYDFSPSGTEFNQQVSLTLGYDVNSLPLRIKSLGTAYYTEDEWTFLVKETSGLAELGKITAPVEHFTVFALLAEVSPPLPTLIPGIMFTVDFLGNITTGRVSEDGTLLQDLVATSPDGAHVIEIEKGTRAFDNENKTVTYIGIREADIIPDLPPNTVLVGKAYEFSPSGTEFNQPIRLILGYDVNNLPLNITSLGTAYYTAEDGWMFLVKETSGLAELGKVTAQVEHFTVFALLGQSAEPAAFRLSNLSITASERKIFTGVSYFIRRGETATISVDVTNEGQQEGIYSATLKVNERDVETKKVTLSPGETRTVSFTFKADERGKYLVQIGDLNGDHFNELWINWWLWAGSLGVFGLLLWGIWKFVIRRGAAE